MKDHYWRAISIDSIIPDCFPPVPLFLKTAGNYVLYKDRDTRFTEADRSRMVRSCTEFMYVRAGDMVEIAGHLEMGLQDLLARDDLNSVRKGRILYQTSINYLVDAFEAPEHAANVERCRKLVQYVMGYIASDQDALAAISSIVSHNMYIYVHSVQTMILNLLAHQALFNLAPDELIDVGVGSLLHDYGMIFVTSDILNKPDALSDVEYYQIKKHAQKGYESLKDARAFSDVSLTIVRHHHERYDGNGYPTAMKGDLIPRSAQLSALCDMYSALTLDRPYRKAVSHEKAVAMMSEESGGAFHPGLLAAFIDLVGAKNGGGK